MWSIPASRRTTGARAEKEHETCRRKMVRRVVIGQHEMHSDFDVEVATAMRQLEVPATPATRSSGASATRRWRRASAARTPTTANYSELRRSTRADQGPHPGRSPRHRRRDHGSGGGLVANVTDLSKWMIAQLDSGRMAGGASRLLSQQRTRDMWTGVTVLPIASVPADMAALQPNFNEYGWFICDYRGRKLLTPRAASPAWSYVPCSFQRAARNRHPDQRGNGHQYREDGASVAARRPQLRLPGPAVRSRAAKPTERVAPRDGGHGHCGFLEYRFPNTAASASRASSVRTTTSSESPSASTREKSRYRA
jgi:hypothetical protein